jgi:hypothetical protein
MELPVVRKGEVAPDPVHGNAEQLRVVVAEFAEDLVVERHLVAADRAPVCRVEGEDHRPAAESH